MKTLARGEGAEPLPLAFREVWEPSYRRRPLSYLRLAVGFLVSLAVWSAAVLALIIVAAELWR